MQNGPGAGAAAIHEVQNRLHAGERLTAADGLG